MDKNSSDQDLVWASAAIAALLRVCIAKAAADLEAQAYELQKLAAQLRKEA